jgi:hypothetical protein
MSTLPPSFCGAVRDPYLKRQSQYKAFEWMALTYWYIVPIGCELGFNSLILQNFASLAKIIETAMTISPRSLDDLTALHGEIKKFLIQFERLYVGQKTKNISRCRLCVFQLIHVPQHILWYGSVRLGSQATVERTIGEAGHKIRSKKAPFAHMANLFYEKQLVKLLLLHYPDLSLSSSTSKAVDKSPFFSRVAIRKKEKVAGQPFYKHLQSIFSLIRDLGQFDPMLKVQRFGKLHTPNGATISSRLSEENRKTGTRSSRYFEAKGQSSHKPIFGEALAYYHIEDNNAKIVVYHPLTSATHKLNKWVGKWSEEIAVLPISEVINLVGIWAHNNNIYILQKHPSLDWLAEGNCDLGDSSGDEEQEGADEMGMV